MVYMILYMSQKHNGRIYPWIFVNLMQGKKTGRKQIEDPKERLDIISSSEDPKEGPGKTGYDIISWQQGHTLDLRVNIVEEKGEAHQTHTRPD